MPSAPSPALTDPLAAIRPRLRRALIGVGILSTSLNFLLLAGSLFMMLVYDLVLPGRSIPTLAGLFGLVLLAYLFQGVLDVLRARIMSHMAVLVDQTLEAPVHDLVTAIARGGSPADATRPVRDLDQVRAFLSGSGPATLVDLPWILFFIGVLYLLHPWIAVTVLVGAVLLLGLTFLTDWATRQRGGRLASLAGERQRHLDSSRQHAETAYALGMEARLREQWLAAHRGYRGANDRLAAMTGTLGGAGKVFRMFLQSAVLSVGALLVIDGQASGGVIFASSILSSRALAPVEQLIANWRAMTSARQSWAQLKTMIAQLPPARTPHQLPSPRSALSIESLAIRAPGMPTPIVRDVSFITFAGSAIAMLGPSGSGKSTLLRGIAGILDPAAGTVRLDGATLDQWSREALGKHIGYLPQDVDLIGGTIAQNIARFDPDAPSEAIIAAATQAGVHELILRLPGGYNCDVGLNGRHLSAGQRQRVALARALYGDPFLILLDEPNSNLDPEGEAALIQAVIAAKARNAIVIVVAHRPSVLNAIDQVLLMEAGRVRDFGSKDRVLGDRLRAAPALAPDKASQVKAA